jgi:hypothetical protein
MLDKDELSQSPVLINPFLDKVVMLDKDELSQS